MMAIEFFTRIYSELVSFIHKERIYVKNLCNH